MRHAFLGIFFAAASFLPLGSLRAVVRYAPKNIDWGAVAEEDVVRTAPPRRAPAHGGARPLAYPVEERTLTLSGGSKVRVRERIETNEEGGEDRVFVGGEQLGELSVVARDDAVEAVLACLDARGCTVIRRYGRTGRILRVRTPQASVAASDALIAELSGLAEVGAVSAARSQVRFFLPAGQPSATPNDPYYDRQWSLKTIGADKVWARGYYGYPNVPCAVYDTGVNPSHEDLRENVRRRVSALHSDPSPNDHHGHGSHCLGIMGADGNNGRGITGVGQVANLTSIRGPISYFGEGDSILDGFQWALDNGIRVLSCSFGTTPGVGEPDAAEIALLDELGDAGCLVVIAAGNDHNDNDRVPGYPASYDCPNILAVVATDENDEPADFTNYGATSCDIAAPGVDILSCTRDGPATYESWDGTSMATPIVAACAAMVWERNPSWTWRDVRQRLLTTAVPNPKLLGYCTTAARVDLGRALAQAHTVSADPLPNRVYESGETVSLTVRASEGVHAVTITLQKRDAADYALALGTFDVIPGGATTLEVWTPAAEDKARGYSLRVAAVEDPDAFCYSSLFRVKIAGVPETLAVSAPRAGAELDAAAFPITFTASDALYVSLELEEEGADGSWERVASLGMSACTPGAATTVTGRLKGGGWVTGRRSRVVAFDADDDHVVGISEAFTFVKSSCSVYLRPGNATKEAPEVSDGKWKEEVRVGEEMRLSCWLPETSLYWLLLLDENANAITLKTIVHFGETDLGYKNIHIFGQTIPEGLVEVGKRYQLVLMDAFDSTMQNRSPVFTLLPREDGLAEPSLAEVFGDASGRDYESLGQWYPERQADGGWALRCGWVGEEEEAWFQTTVEGPVSIRFRAKWDIPQGVSVAYATLPILKDDKWNQITHFSQMADWNERTADLPDGTWAVRWTYRRGKEGLGKHKNTLWVDDVRFVPVAEPVRISLNDKVFPAEAAFSGGMGYPGYVTYTLDGSAPTPNSPRWVPGQKLPLRQSARISARSFRDGYDPSDVVTADYVHFSGEGTEASPYLISTAEDLVAFAGLVTAGRDFAGQWVRLANDLDLTGVTLPAIGAVSTRVTEMGWVTVSHAFEGTFDGGSHTLLSPTLGASTVDAEDVDPRNWVRGFIGVLGARGTLKNVTLQEPRMPVFPGTVSMMGYLVGYNMGTVENCHVILGTMDEQRGAKAGALTGINETEGDAIGTIGKGCTFSGTVNGVASPTVGTPPPLRTFLAAPKVSPKPGPFTEPITVTVTAEADIEVSRDGGRTFRPYTGPIALAPIEDYDFVFRATDGTTTSAPVSVSYAHYAKARCPTPWLLALDEAGVTGQPIQDGIFLPPLSLVGVEAGVAGAWDFRYTLDGSEPTAEDLRYDKGGILISKSCTLSVRAFAPPWYDASAVASVRLNVENHEGTVADLTVVHGKRKAGKNWGDTFVVEADPAPVGKHFSHWLVTGPLVLPTPTEAEISFEWLTKSAIVLEAIYADDIPGFRLRLR